MGEGKKLPKLPPKTPKASSNPGSQPQRSSSQPVKKPTSTRTSSASNTALRKLPPKPLSDQSPKAPASKPSSKSSVPKLGPKKDNNGANHTKRQPPPKLGPKSQAQSQRLPPPKLPSKSQKPNAVPTPSSSYAASTATRSTIRSSKLSGNPQSPPVLKSLSQELPRPSPIKTASSPSVPTAAASKESTLQRKPSLGPKRHSIQQPDNLPRPSIPITEAGSSIAAVSSRRPPLGSKKSSQNRSRPHGALSLPKAQENAPSQKSLSQKPPVASRKSASKQEEPLTESIAPEPEPDGADSSSKPASRRPSLQPRRSSRQGVKSNSKTATLQQLPEVDEEGPAHKLSEENRDLKDVLSESQCADLTILIVNVTERMRSSIEKAFDATAGLKLLSRKSKGKDSFADVDYDPGTVDVSAYDKERKMQEEQEKELAKPQAKQLKKAALDWFDDWRQLVIQRVGEVVNSKKTATDQKKEVAAKSQDDQPQKTPQRLQKISTAGKDGEYAPPKLEELFPRVRTPLTKLPIAQRILVLHSIFLLLLSLEHYSAASRVLLLYLTSSLKLGLNSLRQDEENTAQGLLEAAKQMTAQQETDKKKAESQESRKWKIRLASAAGAAIIGYTGGMAAPMVAAGVGSVMGELGLGATAAAGYLGTVAGNTAIVGSLFGAYGGRMTGQIMSNISAEVEDFAFLPVHGERKEHAESLDAATDKRRLRVIVAVSGWLLEKEEVVSPWRVLKPSAEVFALRFELATLMSLGQSFDTMLSSAAYGYAQSAIAQRTVFSELMSAMWPMALVKVARVVDNPFSLAKTRAEKAGEVLAEALMNRAQGERPVTLIGYSLGARVIWSCLMTLARKRGFGFVESAVMMGSPLPSDVNTWRAMRTTVSGRLVNVYSENDYLLAFLYRSASLQYGVAGLMPVIGLAGVENVDVSEMVSGHLRYRYLVGSILDKIRFEDVDKDEVAKESDAFEAMVKEENKNTYQKQIKDNAGNLYEEYGERIGLPKQGRSLLPQKEKEATDAKSDKEASKMEKEIQQKTQKGLMQWAVEQLYISRPEPPSTEDVKDAAADPQAAAKKTGKDAKKTSDAATKSLYQRASEALYLSRSGGPEGEAAAREKLSQAQKASPDQTESYLSTAAGYIPTGYLPSFGSSPKRANNTQKPKIAKRPSTLSKSKSKSRGSTTTLKKPESEKVGESKDNNDPVTLPQEGKKPTEIAKQTNEGDAKERTSQTDQGYSSYLPSFGRGKSKPKLNEKGQKEPPKTPPNQTDSDDVFGPVAQTEKGLGSAKDQNSDDKQTDVQKAGSGSYLPSIGFGGSSAPEKEEAPTGGPKEHLEVQDSEQGATEGSETSKQASSYGSYLPSFGLGASTSSTPTKGSEPRLEATDQEKEDFHPRASESSDTQPKESESQKNEVKNGDKKDDSKGEEKDDKATPKRKYPWEEVLERGKGVEPADQSSSYTSFLPSFGFGSPASPAAKGKADSGASQDPSKSSEKVDEKGDNGEPAGKQSAATSQETSKKRYPWESFIGGADT